MLNKNQKMRDEILNIEANNPYSGGIAYYEGLTGENLKKLIDENFVELDEQQNCSPTIKDFLKFMEKHPDFTAHGYAVDLNRSDYRVSIEGLECTGQVSRTTERDFVKFCSGADELCVEEGYLRSWWD